MLKVLFWLKFLLEIPQTESSKHSRAGEHPCAGLPMWLEGTLIHSGPTWLTSSLIHKRAWGFRYAAITSVAAAGALWTSPTSAMGPTLKGVQ